MKTLQKVCVVVFAALALTTASAQAASDPLTRVLDGIFGGSQHTQPVRVDRHRGHMRIARHQEAQTSGSHSVLASFYGHGEKLNRYTASGQVFRPNGLTAAHRTLPMGTRLLVSRGGHSVVVTINDRGPAAWTGRSLDLSYGAAQRLGMGGTAPVQIARLN
jgi:rare lipoprotein A